MVHFKSSQVFILFIALAYSPSAAATTDDVDSNIIEPKASQCGGTLHGDSYSLTYPDEGEVLKAGETCVWTVHLETRRDFRFNFTNLNVNSGVSGDENCEDGGVRLYSLTNLVPSDKLESYTFCSEKQWDQTFYLGETVAVIVLYVGQNNSNPGSGFTISWEGSATDSLRTSHLWTSTSLPSGIVRYPVIGAYEPRTIATWLVEADPSANSQTDLVINSLDLELCDLLDDPCACDALIIYGISEAGVLQEINRFCDDIDSSGVSLSLKSRFIIGFFSDLISQEPRGTGFDIIYYPGATLTTPSTIPTTELTTEQPTTEFLTTMFPTDEPTTTESTGTTDPPNVSRECGEILSSSSSGFIIYREHLSTSNNLRCVWTIRVPNSKKIQFDLINSGFSSSGDDFLSILTIEKANNISYETKFDYKYPVSQTSVILNGSVAIVTYATGVSGSSRTGFSLSYEAINSEATGISDKSVDKIIEALSQGLINHPADNSSTYPNNDLSTFVLASPNFIPTCTTPNLCVNIDYYSHELEANCNICDSVYIYQFDRITTPHWKRTHTFFGDTVSANVQTAFSLVLVVFNSDDSGVGNGFHLDYTRLN